MDADERLTALKRAYADIILNTAKEAAARIMASERKAIRFQHELGVAKEQALQMLLRLKNMMDSKASEAGMTCWGQQKTIEELQAQLREAEDSISEAEMRSLSQQSKIEELEAQLHEAEDIVKDVREELREVQGELERVRSSKLLHMDEYNTDTQEETSQANILNTSQSIRFHPPELQIEPFTSFDLRSSGLNQRNEVYKCYSVNDSRIGSSHMGKLDLPSTSEEKRLNTPFSILPSSPELKPESLTGSDLKISPSNQRNEVNKCYNANNFHAGTSHVSKPVVPSIILRRKEPEPFRNRRTLRIRAFEEKLMAGELAFSDTIDVNNETNGREGEEAETKKKNVARADKGNYQGQKVKTLRRKRRRATSYQKKKPPSSRYAFNQALKGDQTSDSSCTKPNNVNASAQSCGDPLNMSPRSIGCKDKDITESDAEFGKDVSVQNTINEDKASIDELLLTRQESGSADRSGVSTCRVNVEKVDVPVPVANSQTETSGTTNGIADYTRTDGRVFKYTFQRKRKKGSLSCYEGNDSLENGVLKKRAAEEQNGPLEAEKSSSITALPRDSRRLAQVARQLISLSEKKW